MDQKPVARPHRGHQLDAHRPPLAVIVLAERIVVGRRQHGDGHRHVTAYQTTFDDCTDRSVGIRIDERELPRSHSIRLSSRLWSSSSKSFPIPSSIDKVRAASSSLTFESAKPTWMRTQSPMSTPSEDLRSNPTFTLRLTPPTSTLAMWFSGSTMSTT